MIEPFHARIAHEGMTYGLGPAGYDVRLELDADGAINGVHLEPGQFRLASTLERFVMPPSLVGRVHDKSSWARRGLAVQNTIIEPGWQGYLTLELSNHGPHTLLLKRGMPIAQVTFEQLDEPTQIPYVGKYQDQERGPQVAR
jgi:dCTP deaminase